MGKEFLADALAHGAGAVCLGACHAAARRAECDPALGLRSGPSRARVCPPYRLGPTACPIPDLRMELGGLCGFIPNRSLLQHAGSPARARRTLETRRSQCPDGCCAASAACLADSGGMAEMENSHLGGTLESRYRPDCAQPGVHALALRVEELPGIARVLCSSLVGHWEGRSQDPWTPGAENDCASQ